MKKKGPKKLEILSETVALLGLVRAGADGADHLDDPGRVVQICMSDCNTRCGCAH